MATAPVRVRAPAAARDRAATEPGKAPAGAAATRAARTIRRWSNWAKIFPRLKQKSRPKTVKTTKSQGQQLANNGSGAAPKEGDNPNATAPQDKPNGAGNAPLPKPGNEARNNLPAPSGGTPSGRRDDKGSMGDTHLGEMPKAGNYERFYKPGEGPGLDIHDARYVMFRLPGTTVGNAGAGRLCRRGTSHGGAGLHQCTAQAGAPGRRRPTNSNWCRRAIAI